MRRQAAGAVNVCCSKASASKPCARVSPAKSASREPLSVFQAKMGAVLAKCAVTNCVCKPIFISFSTTSFEIATMLLLANSRTATV